jgi:hypothetical protein
MKYIMIKIKIVIAIAILLTTLPAIKTEAADRFAVLCLNNNTNRIINYKYKWGDGNWKTSRVRPAGRYWHSWKYKRPNQRKSPPFNISFDSDMSNGKYFQTYKLGKFASPEQSCRVGKKYVFKYDGKSKRYVELYKK